MLIGVYGVNASMAKAIANHYPSYANLRTACRENGKWRKDATLLLHQNIITVWKDQKIFPISKTMSERLFTLLYCQNG